ncbi:hypothetical protein B484DRAFT_239558 [Ochromonadaceae sp. CCMP2298]|nr:hypothetical protein B484DRAFT_239558 [Ochromonadaceae sp. CCMP2298]
MAQYIFINKCMRRRGKCFQRKRHCPRSPNPAALPSIPSGTPTYFCCCASTNADADIFMYN